MLRWRREIWLDRQSRFEHSRRSLPQVSGTSSMSMVPRAAQRGLVGSNRSNPSQKGICIALRGAHSGSEAIAGCGAVKERRDFPVSGLFWRAPLRTGRCAPQGLRPPFRHLARLILDPAARHTDRFGPEGAGDLSLPVPVAIPTANLAAWAITRPSARGWFSSPASASASCRCAPANAARLPRPWHRHGPDRRAGPRPSPRSRRPPARGPSRI